MQQRRVCRKREGIDRKHRWRRTLYDTDMENDVDMLGADNNEAVCNASDFFLFFIFLLFLFCFQFVHLAHVFDSVSPLAGAAIQLSKTLISSCIDVKCNDCRNWMTWRSAWRKWNKILLLCGRCRAKVEKEMGPVQRVVFN